MTTPVEAVFENGILRPMQPLRLAEQQRVWLRVEPIGSLSFEQWLEETKQHREAIKARVGVLPDSTPDIAEDRLRDI